MEPVQKFCCDPMKAESGKTRMKNGEVFQYDKRDSQGTHVTPVSCEAFDFVRYAEYEESLKSVRKNFWKRMKEFWYTDVCGQTVCFMTNAGTGRNP